MINHLGLGRSQHTENKDSISKERDGMKMVQG